MAQAKRNSKRTVPTKHLSKLVKTKKSRVTPMGFRHELAPLFVGLATAEFLPADPQQWLQTAGRAGMQIALSDGRLSMTWQNANPDESDFLKGWLAGTVGGEKAVRAFLDAQRTT